MYTYYTGDPNSIEVSKIYQIINSNALRRECGNLDELLISERDVEFIEVLGEGMQLSITKSFMF